MTASILALAYLLGSIPFGLLLVRASGLGDVRSIGSGNIGATNVMRTGNKKLGIATLLLDAGKGFLAVWIAKHYGLEGMWLYATALIAVLGHVFPVWLKFKGGKGVATAFGVLLGFSPSIFIITGLAWLLVAAITRYVSLASILCFWIHAIIMALYGLITPTAFLLILASLITWKHRANMQRIRAGTEPKIGKKKNV